MIWVQHDFYKNFIHSVNSNDFGLAIDIFRSEVSDLLTYKSKALYSLFDKLKIKYKSRMSYEELLNIILREIKTNDKFIRGLSFLIGENNNVIKNNSEVSWQKLLDGITKGIKKIAIYFEENPKQQILFKRKTLDMIGLKSSVTGDDNRELKKKDNTVLWILGIAAVGIAGYFIYRYYDKKRDARLRAESLMGATPTLEVGGSVAPTSQTTNIQNSEVVAPVVTAPIKSSDPAYNVTPDVLLPEQAMPTVSPATQNMQSGNLSGVNIQVQPMTNPNQVLNNNQQINVGK